VKLAMFWFSEKWTFSLFVINHHERREVHAQETRSGSIKLNGPLGGKSVTKKPQRRGENRSKKCFKNDFNPRRFTLAILGGKAP